MGQKILSANFTLIHWDNEGVPHKCNKCGNLEYMVRGTKKGTSGVHWYQYPDIIKRKAETCSKCYQQEIAEKKAVKPKKRVSPIYIFNCIECDSVFVNKINRGKFCSKECTDLHHRKANYKEYNLICENCGDNFVNNTKKKFCSDKCFKESRIKEKSLKSCKHCGSEFMGHEKDQYCSKECSPWVSTGPRPHKCRDCDNTVYGNIKICQSCKSLKKQTVMYDKECPTCGKQFKTKNKSKLYCKSSHSPSAKELKKLRDRTERTQKLKCETWKDIAEFKKSRPKGTELDHIIPLNHPDVCGLHNTWNFQWLSKEDNNKKSNKFDGTYENDSWKK